MVKVPPSTYSLSPPSDLEPPSLLPPQAARRAAVAQSATAVRLRRRVLGFMDGFLFIAVGVGGSGVGTAYGATDVHVEGTAAAVVALADDQVEDLGRVGPEEAGGVDLLGLGRRCRERGQLEVAQLREHVGDEVAVERERVAAVGQDADRETLLGQGPQEGRLADGVAVVPDEHAAGRL